MTSGALGLLLCMLGPSGAATLLGAVVQSDGAKLDFSIFWPPRDPSMAPPTGVRPLLNGCVQLHRDDDAAGLEVLRLRVRLSRPADEIGCKYWNAQLAFPQYAWMRRVRVWDVDEQWLWPNLAYLLRLHGREREDRYGGVDPVKGVDNDFAAVLIRKFDATGKVESPDTMQAPLVAAEWYPVDAVDVDKQSIVQVVQSDEFTLHLERLEGGRQGLTTIWLIYADFMGAPMPRSWPTAAEYAGGILACFELSWNLKEKRGSEFKLRQIVPKHSTGFDWPKWALKTRSLKDSKSTAKLSDAAIADHH